MATLVAHDDGLPVLPDYSALSPPPAPHRSSPYRIHHSLSPVSRRPKHLLSLPPTPEPPDDQTADSHSYPSRRYGSSPLQDSLAQHLLVPDTLRARSPSMSPSIDNASDLSLSSSESYHSTSLNGLRDDKGTPTRQSASDATPLPPISSRAELNTLVSIAYPIALATLCRAAQSMTDLSFLGHLSTDYLAGSSAALLWMSLTSAILYRAFGAAVNTLCAQAIGASNYRLCGVWLQTSLVLSTAATIPLSVSWWFTGDLLRLIGVSEPIAELAATFARYSILSTWPILIYECLARHYQAQKLVMPALLINFAFVFVNILLNYFFVLGVAGVGGYGYVGSPMATASCRWLLLIVFWVVMHYGLGHKQCWFGWTWECVARNRLKVLFLQQFLPLTLGMAMEELQLEAIALMANRLGEAELATQNAMTTLFMVFSSFSIGIFSATAVRIAHYLGAGRPKAARKTGMLSLYLSLAIGLLTGLAFFVCKSYIGRVFSDDPLVWRLTEQVCTILGPTYMLMAVIYTSMAVVDAQARPMMSALAFIVGAWGVSVPLAYVFAFVMQRGLLGIWCALCLGYTVVGVVLCIACLVSDWRQVSVNAMLRSEKQTTEGGDDTEKDVNEQYDDEEDEQVEVEEEVEEQYSGPFRVERRTIGEKTTEGRLELGEEQKEAAREEEEDEEEQEDEVEEEEEEVAGDEVVDVDIGDGAEELEEEEDEEDGNDQDSQPGSTPKSPGLLPRHQRRSDPT